MNTVPFKGIPLELGGETYVVPPLSLRALEGLAGALSSFSDEVGFDRWQIDAVIDATTAALKRNYPHITREQVADMIDLENVMAVTEAVMDVSGAKRKEKEAATDSD
ncbi:hypothetical protein [Lysobacter sp. Root494]|uniref:hypothetical protein n=1 Tax=Lysobacter sp. Root494 TaxID=1736549 RepID=UPI0006F6D38E|nr:hypothetical protein [Lysobacter sp. Root494]KQY51188.1 hypothetical protein ASD14_10315 [Lysobacter sp. Root494]